MTRFARVDWSEDAGRGLALAIKYANDGEILEAEVRAGRAELWKADDGVSWLITRVEGSELVLCCFQGKNTRAMFRDLYKHACSLGFHSLRFHTQQPWLIELLRDYDPEPLEYVVRVFTDGWKKQKFYKHVNITDDDKHAKYRHD